MPGTPHSSRPPSVILVVETVDKVHRLTVPRHHIRLSGLGVPELISKYPQLIIFALQSLSVLNIDQLQISLCLLRLVFCGLQVSLGGG